MSSEEREPENDQKVKGNTNKVVQGDGNKVNQGINLNVFALFHIFSNKILSHSPSPHEPPRSNRKKPKLQRMGTLIVISVVGLIVVPMIIDIFPKDASNSPGISLGEEILIEQNIPIQEQLKTAFLAKDYQQFRYLLTDYLKEHPNSPELWVYWNNAKAALFSKNPIKIGVSIPIGTNPGVAKEILRGVALAQNEINDDSLSHNGINGHFLQIIIANDDNNSDLAKKVAQSFVQDPSILAVVGHNASDASLVAKDIYRNKLAMITPTSFSDKIQDDPYIFRMVPQISYFANKLARYIDQENPNSIVGTCVDPKSPDNDSFMNQFKATFSKNVFRLSCEFLNNKELDDDSLEQAAKNIVKKIKQYKINSLVIAPYVNNVPKSGKIFTAIHNDKLPIRLYGSPTFFLNKTLEMGQASEGLTLFIPWYPNKNSPKSIHFRKNFQQLYQTSIENWRTAMAYDATWIIATGLEHIFKEDQEINREQLNKALRGEAYSDKKGYPKFSYDGATGKTTFSDGGVNENQADVIVKIENQKFVPIPKIPKKKD